MTPSRNSFVLILLLTLLQCFAPLLHAHTFGDAQGSGVHLYDVAELHSGELDGGHTHALSAHAGDESPAIGMVQEYRQDSAMALSDAEQPLPPLFPQVSSRSERFLICFHAASPPGASSHLIPFSQAPPLTPV
jgi:hypothetical protein